jgi:hypothetical protein
MASPCAQGVQGFYAVAGKDPMPTVVPKAIGCNMEVVQLDGPWSIGGNGLGAIP